MYDFKSAFDALIASPGLTQGQRVRAVDDFVLMASSSFRERLSHLDELIARGDLSEFDHGFPPLGDVGAERQKRIPKLLAPEFGAQNFELCAPLLRDALAGDAQARKQYEALRLVHPLSLPRWSHDPIDRMFRERFDEVTYTIPSSLNPPLSEKMKQKITNNSWNALSSNNPSRIVTYQNEIETCRISDAVRGIYEAAGVPNTYLYILHDQRTGGVKGHQTPFVGAGLVECNRFLATMYLNTRLLEDLNNLLGLSIDDRRLGQILSSSPVAWDVCKHPLLPRATAIRDILQEHPQLWPELEALFLAKNPSSRAQQLLQDPIRVSSHDSSEGDEITEQIDQNTLVGVGLRRSLETFTSLVPNEIADVSRRLKAYVRRGKVSLGAVMARIRDDVSALEILAELDASLAAEKALARAEGADIEVREPSIVVQNGQKQAFQILVHEKHFQRKLDNLPRSLRYFVEERLQRIADDGHEGDSEKLKATSDLYALRIDKGPGIRVFYTKFDDYTWSLITLCSKKEYTEAVERAVNFLKAGYTSVPYL